ncbi:MAG: hypothetical protein HYU56_01875 [Candidatus Aenigmarchaeota archaeon]|nr:hypothetical protein [Candidatus Aenigmarchaeota archaeon]
MYFIGEQEILELPYVDSGADITLIPNTVGELLGFEKENDNIKEVYSVGKKSIPIIIKKIKLRIANHEFEARVAWALTENVPILLGRMDVFDKFKITFDQAKKKTIFELKP